MLLIFFKKKKCILLGKLSVQMIIRMRIMIHQDNWS